jgi:hypothetical protein
VEFRPPSDISALERFDMLRVLDEIELLFSVVKFEVEDYGLEKRQGPAIVLT